MAEIEYCDACAELKERDPNMIANGFSDTECNYLQNDKGITGENNDCTDLNLMNDCLIGSMIDEADITDVCDWRDYMKNFGTNVWTMFKAVICAICGLWKNIHKLWDDLSKVWNDIKNIWESINDVEEQVKYASYIGILTMKSTVVKTGDGKSPQILPFNTSQRMGNIDSSVLSVVNGYKGIRVRNTTNVDLLVESTFNCSIDTDQRIACCYIITFRDGKAVGQTPFITPDTYDQQVMSEPFILRPGESSVMSYEFRIGAANPWFQRTFGYKNDGSGEPKCAFDETGNSDPRHQASYFSVKVTSVVSEQ